MGNFTEQEVFEQSLKACDISDRTRMEQQNMVNNTRTELLSRDDQSETMSTDPALPSPGGASTGSVSTTNNTNSYISSDANSVSSSELADAANGQNPELLKAQIKYQVEFYFSPQNLNRDAYMQSQMNSEGYIPVSVIAEFKQVKKLTSDQNLILEAIKGSTICTSSSDNSMIKASWKRPPRTTIIIREVEEGTTEEDVRALFNETSYKIVSVRSDVAQTWFVTLDSEEEAKNALFHVIGKTLNGQGIKARLKSEAMPVPTPAGPPAGMPVWPNDGFNQQQYYGGYPVPMGYNVVGYPNGGMPQWNQSTYTGFDPMTQRGENLGVINVVPTPQPIAGGKTSSSGGAKGMRADTRRQPVQNASKSAMLNKKKKPTNSKRIKTPVFKAYDFPSLPMGKMTLDEEGVDKEAKLVDERQSTAAPLLVNTSRKSPAGSSWAQAVAKVQSPPALTTTPAPSPVESPKPSPAAKPSVSKQPAQQQQQRAAKPVDATEAPVRAKVETKPEPVVVPAARPKRGWEKPGLSPGKADAKAEVKENNQEQQKTVEKEPVAKKEVEKGEVVTKEAEAKDWDGEMKKAAFGAWGAKKSFAEVIKAGGEVRAESPVAVDRVVVAKEVKKSEPARRTTRFGQGRGSSMDNDWRRKDVPPTNRVNGAKTVELKRKS